MKPSHIVLAVVVAAVWGINFVVTEIGLTEFPPLFFSAVRFLLCVIPAIFFIGGPRVKWRWVFAVGMLLGVFMFGLMFLGMYAGMPAGLTSLVMQSQVVFTALLGAVLLSERPGRAKLIGVGVAITGIVVIGVEQGLGTTPLAFALVIGAAVFWSMSNIAQRQAQPPDIFRFMVWISVVPPIPLFALSAMTEDFGAGVRALTSMSGTALGSALYVAWISTLFGFGAWGYLLRTYATSSVAPFSLLVPIFGMSTAALVLDERITTTELAAAALIIIGVSITVLPKRRKENPVADPFVPAAPN